MSSNTIWPLALLCGVQAVELRAHRSTEATMRGLALAGDGHALRGCAQGAPRVRPTPPGRSTGTISTSSFSPRSRVCSATFPAAARRSTRWRRRVRRCGNPSRRKRSVGAAGMEPLHQSDDRASEFARAEMILDPVLMLGDRHLWRFRQVRYRLRSGAGRGSDQSLSISRRSISPRFFQAVGDRQHGRAIDADQPGEVDLGSAGIVADQPQHRRLLRGQLEVIQMLLNCWTTAPLARPMCRPITSSSAPSVTCSRCARRGAERRRGFPSHPHSLAGVPEPLP